MGEPVGFDETGAPIFADYRVPKEVVKAQRQQANQGKSVGWAELLDHWLLIELDLLEIYGVDVWDPALLRPWPWWRDRILGLLTAGGRLAKALTG